MYDFIFNEVNTSFAKKKPDNIEKESVFGIDMLTSLQMIKRNVYGYFVANITKADKLSFIGIVGRDNCYISLYQSYTRYKLSASTYPIMARATKASGLTLFSTYHLLLTPICLASNRIKVNYELFWALHSWPSLIKTSDIFKTESSNSWHFSTIMRLGINFAFSINKRKSLKQLNVFLLIHIFLSLNLR